jgi:hypothetical protein
MPAWCLTVHLSHFWRNSELSFEEKRDGIVDVLRKSRWRHITPCADSYVGLVDELEETGNIEWFDAVFNELYSLADSDGVWIETHGKVVKVS